MENSKEYFFVYGTLKIGGHYAKSFDKERTTSEAGYISKAQIFDLGPYPAIQETSFDRDVVYGEVHTYENPEAIREAWDHIEGYFEDRPEQSHYLRKKVEVVTTQDGESVEAWAYFINILDGEPSPKDRGWKFLESGFWPVPDERN